MLQITFRSHCELYTQSIMVFDSAPDPACGCRAVLTRFAKTFLVCVHVHVADVGLVK